jgi:hypothetical protein
MLNDEAALVIEQENNRIATEGVVIRAAAASVLSKEGGQHFSEVIQSLGDEQ